jgi:metal-dependent amidase/aminoacylase/carboxypeptidase family protein
MRHLATMNHVDTEDYVFVDPIPPLELPESDTLKCISEYIDSISDNIWPLNKKIHDNPELGYHEEIAHDTLTRFLKCQSGWDVTTSAYGIETAFVAVFDSGKKGPVVSFNAEYGWPHACMAVLLLLALTMKADALPQIGHACGHNLIASASLVGALATAKVLKDGKLNGKVVLYGTPAEEGETSMLLTQFQIREAEKLQVAEVKYDCSMLVLTRIKRSTST